jgi:hypothetical protein
MEKVIQDQESIESYIQHVFQRGEMLIQNKLWDGLNIVKYRGWLNNFITMEERLLAALLIDRLIYRSNEHVMSMLIDLFTVCIPNSMRLNNDPYYQQNRKLWTRLCERSDRHIRLVNTNDKDKPSQSSGDLLNTVNHQMNLKQGNTIYLNQIDREYNKGVNTFILLDDMICTGEQMRTTLDQINFEQYPDVRFYIAVCCACDEGISYIHEKYPKIPIVFTEKLKVSQHSFFQSIDFGSIPFENMEKMKIFYEEFTKGKGFNPSSLYGKGNLALVYAFESSTPNASIPILYFRTAKFNQFLNKRGS